MFLFKQGTFIIISMVQLYKIAEKSLPKYQDLAHMLEKGKIESISAGNQSSPEMFFKS